MRIKLYNTSNRIRTIIKVFVSIGIPSTNGNVVVDVHKNGATIFTNQNNRPVISGLCVSGESSYIDVPLWSPGEYIEAAIDSIGTNASNLMVHVCYI